jgi:hypothetical protein
MYQSRRVVKAHLIKYPAGLSSEVSGTPAADSEAPNPNPQPLEARDLNLPEDRPFSLEPYYDDGFMEDLDDHPILDAEGRQNEPPGSGLPVTDTHFEPVEPLGPEAPGADHDQEDQPATVPRAFLESPSVRMAYLQAVISNVKGKLLIPLATDQLNATLDALLVAGVLPDFPRPVRHLSGAKRRLGIDPDQWITLYAVCPVCWKHQSPAELKALNSPLCSEPGCDGIYYSEHYNSKGKQIRTAIKINPQTSLIGTLRRMLMRPGFAAKIRDNRQDHPGRNDDDDFVMRDMYDGANWHAGKTNITREVGNHGTVRDVSGDEPGPSKMLYKHRYGLHLSMNADGYHLAPSPHMRGSV